MVEPPERARPERFVTVWCPDWPITAAGYGPDQPAAVMSGHRVVARTAAAAAAGVVIGQRRRQAQSRCPGIELIERDATRDAREFEPVVRAVAEMAPRLDVVEPGWISLAARGPSRYFGGDEAMAAGAAERVAEAADGSATVGVGVADGRFAASVAARIGARREAPVVIEPGGARAFCAPLAIGWLHTLDEADADLIDLFVRLGIRRLGQLAELSESDVLGRFGQPGVHAHRLAAGADERRASTDDPPLERRVTKMLDDPIAQSEAVVFIAKQLADEVAGRLAAVGSVCTRLVVQFETEHGERSERSWYRSTGLSASAMVERVRWQLDAWMRLPRGSTGEITAGVALVRLIPDEIMADRGVQLGLWGGQSDADRRAGAAIARLTTLTSEQAVTVPVWSGGRLPAERYRWVPATTVDLDGRGGPGFVSVTGVGSSTSPAVSVAAPRSGGGGGGVGGGSVRDADAERIAAPWPGSLPPPSPATVYPDPIPVEVIDAVGEPIRVSGRGIVSAPPVAVCRLLGDEHGGWRRGAARPVRSWAGPWPIDQRWWEPAQHRRLARFQMIVDEGEQSDGKAGQRHDGEGTQAVLVVAEHRRWWVIARYD